jgi:hypothetical protein
LKTSAREERKCRGWREKGKGEGKGKGKRGGGDYNVRKNRYTGGQEGRKITDEKVEEAPARGFPGVKCQERTVKWYKRTKQGRISQKNEDKIERSTGTGGDYMNPSGRMVQRGTEGNISSEAGGRSAT